ncbi:MAG: non-canonical purine NTP pyrophosphatase [Saprospiraceae bacterium]|nr:MAG: non-canonical purine NTP pyrophosphatase [Saprospiraceae bacterium]
MKKIVFATGNANKVQEVNELLAGQMQIISLIDIGHTEDIPETGATLEENALQKANFVKTHYQLDCFSEDTGLEIDALDGAPGVYTARYAGPERDAGANMDLVLQQLQHSPNRNARFRTVIALILNGETHLFEGIAEGKIALQQSGVQGFGYDPVFIPKGYSQTFAEMNAAEKNAISHRGRAIQKLIDFLSKRMDV